MGPSAVTKGHPEPWPQGRRTVLGYLPEPPSAEHQGVVTKQSEQRFSSASPVPGDTWSMMHVHARACVCVCVWCVHTHMCVCVRSGLLSCSHCPFLNRRPGGASVPVHVAISYLRRNYPWCVRFIWDESYKDNFFLSIKSCLSGLAEPHDEFHRDACVNPLGGSCLAGG